MKEEICLFPPGTVVPMEDGEIIYSEDFIEKKKVKESLDAFQRYMSNIWIPGSVYPGVEDAFKKLKKELGLK